MTHIRPVDMPALRNEVLQVLTDIGPRTYEGVVQREAQYYVPDGADPAQLGRMLADEEISRIAKAELYYVSSSMLDLAKVAERSLPTFSLMPHDLPSHAGFVLFEDAIDVVDYGTSISPIIGASWGPFDTSGAEAFHHWTDGGLWVTWYSDVSACIQSAVDRKTIDESHAAVMRARLGRVQVDNETQIPFSREEIAVWDDSAYEESAVELGERAEPVALQYGERMLEGMAHWVGILKTIWMLMGQPIATTANAHFDRATRRQLQRAEVDLAAVRVITLRRPKGEGDGEADREYHHRWIVRGHWRMQPHGPGRSRVRPVWIAPHIKGPEDAPLLGGEKVYALKR